MKKFIQPAYSIKTVKVITILSAVLLFLTYSNSQSKSLSTEIEMLRNQADAVHELKHSIASLEQEVRALKRILSRSKLVEPAVFPGVVSLNASHKDDPFLGAVDGTVIIMAFSEYQCRPCRQFVSKIFPMLKKDYLDAGKVKYILRDFPLASNDFSIAAANLAHCAGEQGAYWQMHSSLFAHPVAVDAGDWALVSSQVTGIDKKKLEQCSQSLRYKKEIELDIKEAKSIGIKGAPGFFLGKRQPSGKYTGFFIRGAQPYAVFRTQLEKLLGRGA